MLNMLPEPLTSSLARWLENKSKLLRYLMSYHRFLKCLLGILPSMPNSTRLPPNGCGYVFVRAREAHVLGRGLSVQSRGRYARALIKAYLPTYNVDVNIARRKLHGILCVTPRLKRCARLPPKSGRQRNIRARNGQ